MIGDYLQGIFHFHYFSSNYNNINRWQHLNCSFFNPDISPLLIPGYQDLDDEAKNLVQNRINETINNIDTDLIPIEPDELIRKEWNTPMEPSRNMLMPLLPYQKEGLGWMMNQEMNDVHGGILADEMGMGIYKYYLSIFF